MNRIEFDRLKDSLKASNPLVEIMEKAIEEQDFSESSVLNLDCPAPIAAQILVKAHLDREKIIYSVRALTGLCWQDAEVKITQHCRSHNISWSEFQSQFLAGQIPELFSY